MGARDKINGMCGLGALAIAGLFGAASQSWMMFFVIAALLFGVFIMSGDIRLNKQGLNKPRFNKQRRR